ncbi:Integrator complex subunit 11 [Amazona aestiva]|uniref:Integrator complex subunit 11 n=1 Tax=Amazona aestiva TaxID=12930 RepID=A0A0Q3UQG0_AMAAE|nr:Integrator complex subunit 11 [Amazona aestiva]
MPEIKVTPLGAGQDVGRSCILVSIAGKNVMLDCGMHMGYNDDWITWVFTSLQRRFPDFSYITQNGRLTDFLDCVIISHFHLDHCGALPYFSEMVGYDGPIYMTHPTKAICPILLEDYRKITVDKKGETNFFTSQMIKDCMKKVVAVHLHQTVQVDEELEIKAYYAGHVLGAAMFQIKVGCESVVYTGDYNMTPDRHLGHFHLDHCGALPYFSEMVGYDGPIYMTHPTKAICPILLEDYRKITVDKKGETNFFTSQMIKDCMKKVVAVHLHQTVQVDEELEIKAYYAGHVLGAAMFQIKVGCESVVYTVIMPGYCVQGTVGHKILSGQRKLEMEGRQILEVKMQVEYMSFSAHADAKGIMQLIRQAEPRNVLLVHGEAKKMEFLKQKIEQEFHVSCYMPANGETTTIFTNPSIPVDISLGLLKRETAIGLLPDVKKPKLMHGTLMMKDNSFRLVSPEQALKELGLAEHQLRFTCRVHIQDPRKEHETVLRVYNHLKGVLKDYSVQHLPDGSITVESILIQATAHSEDQGTKVLLVSWTYQDEELGSYLTSLLKKGLPQSTA